MTSDDNLRSYLEALPAVFREGDTTDMLAAVLRPFARLLSGFEDPKAPPLENQDPNGLGLEQIADSIERYATPASAPEEFLDWLASWVALSLSEDWDSGEKRRMIGRVVPLYRKRGTAGGLRELLKIYTGLEAKVEDDPNLPANFFRVTLALKAADALEYDRQLRIAQAIINQEKPAHTAYRLIIEIPSTMRVGLARIGHTTLLGSLPSTAHLEK
jgi:phage tail-like protein